MKNKNKNRSLAKYEENLIGFFGILLVIYFILQALNYLYNLILSNLLASALITIVFLLVCYVFRRQIIYSFKKIGKKLSSHANTHAKKPHHFRSEQKAFIPEDQSHYAAQLDAIGRAVFVKRKSIFNDEEREVFHAIRKAIKYKGISNLFLHGQVSLGEMIGASPEIAYRAINTKRVDFVITDSFGNTKIAIEYRGAGSINNESDELRNKVKSLALKRAGIAYIDVFDPDDAARKISELI